ncbi:MAG: bacteriohemerythrin [Syntrophobacteraceae bacterium]|nr:bacteriohemerythrin [Syntrophobacteraceae bacterium]
MGLLVWSEKYSVNIQEIDDQHKKLIGMVGRLNDAMSEGKDKEALGIILGDLLDYTRTHFADEERLMQAVGYPDFETHKAKHTWLTCRVAELCKGYQEGRVTISREVMMFLQNWVGSHIMGTDKDYAPFLDGRGN